MCQTIKSLQWKPVSLVLAVLQLGWNLPHWKSSENFVRAKFCRIYQKWPGTKSSASAVLRPSALLYHIIFFWLFCTIWALSTTNHWRIQTPQLGANSPSPSFTLPLLLHPLSRGLGSAVSSPPWSGAEPQRKSNLMHFSLKIWHLVAPILLIFLRNWDK